MSDSKYSGSGADWTQLLTDPSLVSHLGELLQIYREAPPEKRDQALLEAMRGIMGNVPKAAAAPSKSNTEGITASLPVVEPVAVKPVATSPQPVPLSNQISLRRLRTRSLRRHTRMKCLSQSNCDSETQPCRSVEICRTPDWADALSKPLRRWLPE
jgi:hypothetical protein